ncbi:hypothetical protein J6590_080723 [Homalodisca vitripennis]|nr:hypothetical protein J6590_080723 [Homalodisca vitripennis]
MNRGQTLLGDQQNSWNNLSDRTHIIARCSAYVVGVLACANLSANLTKFVMTRGQTPLGDRQNSWSNLSDRTYVIGRCSAYVVGVLACANLANAAWRPTEQLEQSVRPNPHYGRCSAYVVGVLACANLSANLTKFVMTRRQTLIGDPLNSWNNLSDRTHIIARCSAYVVGVLAYANLSANSTSTLGNPLIT